MRIGDAHALAAAGLVDVLDAARARRLGELREIVYAGMDWVDPKLARRSMELMATEVMPRIMIR